MNKTIVLEFTDITPQNRKEKLAKAISIVSKQIGIPAVIEHSHNEKKGEPFNFKAAEDLTVHWYDYFEYATNSVYTFVADYLGLPIQNVVQKADDPLVHKGRIIFNPDTGEPIKKSDWEKFVKALERVVNGRFAGTGKRIILDSQALGRILDRMLKYSKVQEVADAPLAGIKYAGKTFDWIKDDVSNLKKTFADIRERRIDLLEHSAAERVTGATEQMKHDIRQIIVDGVKARKGKQQISQDLFDKLSAANRNFRKIADSEIQNNINNAFLQSETENLPANEKAYFQRVEIIDDKTCPFCKKNNGVIAVWSNTPLTNDKVKNDPYATVAIWEGKDWNGGKDSICAGIFHPFCRGIWVRWNSSINAYSAMLQKKTAKWNAAVEKAREEFKAKGIENPSDKTAGYTERINELYNSDIHKSLLDTGNILEKSMPISEKLFRLWCRRVDPEFLEAISELYKDGRFISKKIYAIKGYPEGQDLENCELLEFGDNYFTLACGGDWQDEKLVKIEFDGTKLKAKVIDTVNKEDQRVLKKKTDFAFNGTERFYERLKQALDVDKSLTWSGHKLQDRYNFNGLNISIENKKGSTRSGKDKDGHDWHTYMNYDYGYIRGTEGVDGDQVDCYIGDNPDAKNVYIIHQNDPVTGKYDEDKCMLGFNTKEEAREAYLKQYDRPGFLGSMITMSFDEFKDYVTAKTNHARRINP